MPIKSIAFAIDKRPGVYRLQNLVTGKFYIGSSKNLYNRYYNHFNSLKEKTHDNSRIRKDCEENGYKSFVFGVVEYCAESDMLHREQHYFEIWNPEYNVWTNVYSAKGRGYTPEQLARFKEMSHGPKDLVAFSEKLKEAWIRRKQKFSPEELSKKMADARRGIKHSEETKAKYSLMRKGKKKPEGFGEKIRKARLKMFRGY